MTSEHSYFDGQVEKDGDAGYEGGWGGGHNRRRCDTWSLASLPIVHCCTLSLQISIQRSSSGLLTNDSGFDAGDAVAGALLAACALGQTIEEGLRYNEDNSDQDQDKDTRSGEVRKRRRG